MQAEPHYTVTIAWSDRDQAFVARVPELPGCMAHGATYEDALANIEDAMALWLDTAREDGLQLPEPSPYAAVV